MTTQTIAGALKQATGVSIGYSILMVVFGVLAIGLPLGTGIGIAILVAWAMVLGGFAHLAYAFAAESAATFVWRFLIGILYIVGGFYLAFQPGLTLESLTLVLAGVFFAEGALRILFFFQIRSLPGAGWALVDGILTIVLGLVIARSWPDSSAWAIGTIVGVNLLVSGSTRLMYSMAARRALKEAL